MEKLIRQFTEFVTELTGLPAVWRSYVSESLPHYLVQRYSIFEGEVGGYRFAGICIKDSSDFSPGTFEKHLAKIGIIGDLEGYCLIAESLPPYTIKRLRQHGIPFVIPGYQVNWPELGLAVRRKAVKPVVAAIDVVSPATQAVLIHVLTSRMQRTVTPTMLAERLRYTPMTMHRALDEIETIGIGGIRRVGRARQFEIQKVGSELWGAVLPYLRNPVQKAVRVLRQNDMSNAWVSAGETALSEMSGLAAPKEPVYAVSRKRWREVGYEHDDIPFEDHGTCIVQVWKYDPALFAQSDRVDCFSLYLTLRESTDARVQGALREMMESVAWS